MFRSSIYIWKGNCINWWEISRGY